MEVPQKPFSMDVHTTRHLCFYKLLAMRQLTPLGSVSSTSLLEEKIKSKQFPFYLLISLGRPAGAEGEESKEESCGSQLSVQFFIPTRGRADQGPRQAL